MQNSDSDGEPDMERPVNPPPPPPPELYEIESDDSLDEEILLWDVTGIYYTVCDSKIREKLLLSYAYTYHISY